MLTLFIWGVSLTHPMLTLFLCGEFLLHIPRWGQFHRFFFSFSFSFFFSFILGSFSYTSRVWFFFLFFSRGVSITHPVLVSFYLGSFSYTSHAGLIFIWGVFLTHPTLALFFCGEFLLHIPMLALIISGDFLLYIACWLYCSVANFSYTSHATFIFMRGISFTHPNLPSFLCG